MGGPGPRVTDSTREVCFGEIKREVQSIVRNLFLMTGNGSSAKQRITINKTIKTVVEFHKDVIEKLKEKL